MTQIYTDGNCQKIIRAEPCTVLRTGTLVNPRGSVGKRYIKIILLLLIPVYTFAFDRSALPDPLLSNDGKVIKTKKDWQNTRRAEVLELFRTHVYGRVPDTPYRVDFDVFEMDRNALGGKAIRKQVAIDISAQGKELRIELLIYLPQGAEETPVPTFTTLNFRGNHTVHPDPKIALPKNFIKNGLLKRHRKNTVEELRGIKKDRYCVEDFIRRGYGFATAHYYDIDPDFHDEFQNGIHPLLDKPGKRADDAWGTISAWAWGLSRIMDYLQTDPEIDNTKIAVMGHSRLGKTALWAGAQDERFAIVISNSSGCGGAQLQRASKTETIAQINKHFPHWFCTNYKRYSDNVEQMPVDHHMLIALVAPRPVYIASASEDRWADPNGEFLSGVYAEPVYNLFGLAGLETETMPEPDQPINHGHIGYHLRTGKHDLTEYDVNRFMDFADRHWQKK